MVKKIKKDFVVVLLVYCLLSFGCGEQLPKQDRRPYDDNSVAAGVRTKSKSRGEYLANIVAASSNVEKRCSPCVSIGRDRDYERLYDSNDNHGPYYDRIRPRYRDDEQLFANAIGSGSGSSTTAGGNGNGNGNDEDFWDYKKLSSPSYNRKTGANSAAGQQYHRSQTHHNNPYYDLNDRRNPQSNRLRFPTNGPDDYYDSPNAGPGYRGNGYDNLNEFPGNNNNQHHQDGHGNGAFLIQNDHTKGGSNFDHRKYRYKNDNNGGNGGYGGGYDDYRRSHERNFINQKSQLSPLAGGAGVPGPYYDLNERQQPFQKGYDEWTNFEQKNGGGGPPGFGSYSGRHRDPAVYGLDCLNTAAGSSSIGVGDEHSNAAGAYRSKYYTPRLHHHYAQQHQQPGQLQSQPQQVSSHHFSAEKGDQKSGGGNGTGNNSNGNGAAGTIATSYLHDRNNSLVSETNRIQTTTTTTATSSV